MSTSTERLGETQKKELGGYAHTTIRPGEIERHPANVRFVHWAVAICFVLALLSGLAIYTPWLYHWLTPLFGGGAMTRFLHPWFALGFVFFYIFEMKHWLGKMTWTASDRRWMKDIKRYVTNEDKLEPEYVGFFNGGQKAFFWVTAGSAGLFLLSGIVMWFPEIFGRILAAISYVLHDIAALNMLAAFVVHVYLSTVAEEGTLQSMTRGTVSEKYAWTHHPAWYKEATGRDPRAEYQNAVERQRNRREAADKTAAGTTENT